MEIKISFPGNKKVAAEFNGFTVLTDQPKESGGEGSAPAPFDLFLASIGACAGIFVLSFCQKRGISSEGIELIETIEWDEATHRVSKVGLEVVLPGQFPDKYQDSVVAAANLCTVKKHLLNPPTLEVKARRQAASPL